MGKKTPPAHHRRKQWRLHCVDQTLAGMVNNPDGIWVKGPGPATANNYANTLAGAARRKAL